MDLQQLTMKEKLDFLSEGTYGCAFKKEEPKKGPTKVIVKIQKYTPGAKREDDIGKLIRKIPKYSTSCAISIFHYFLLTSYFIIPCLLNLFYFPIFVH